MTDELHRRFTALHHASTPLLLANAWDAASARLMQEAGATAVATSSAAVAWSRGYADGGALPREELLGCLRDIVRVTSVPVTCDLEDGYADDPREVAALVCDVVASGAVGINLEDGGGSPELLCAKIKAIRQALGTRPLFVNARTDVCLRNMAQGAEAVQMSIDRLRAYAQAGADGSFVPGMCSADDAAAVAQAVDRPLNLMAMRGLAPIDALAAAGVRRISAGPALFRVAYAGCEHAAAAFLGGDFDPALSAVLDYGRMNALFAR